MNERHFDVVGGCSDNLKFFAEALRGSRGRQILLKIDSSTILFLFEVSAFVFNMSIEIIVGETTEFVGQIVLMFGEIFAALHI